MQCCVMISLSGQGWSPRHKNIIGRRNLISEVNILSSVLRGAAGVIYTVFIAKEMSQLEYRAFFTYKDLKNISFFAFSFI